MREALQKFWALEAVMLGGGKGLPRWLGGAWESTGPWLTAAWTPGSDAPITLTR